MAERRRRRQVGSTRRPHRALVIGATLVGAAIAAEFVTIALQTAPRPPLPTSALRAVLPSASDSAPALTWTNASPDPTGGPLDPTGRKPLLAAACEGGGAIAVDLSDTTSITLDCSDLHTAGPIELARALPRQADDIDVEVTSGNPRYIVELLASAG